ncbi:MAG: hypothetical protein HQL32_01520 [Planctomycetes bacterium]|nr:hypothetical protein [Planctomycetota bacterium]
MEFDPSEEQMLSTSIKRGQEGFYLIMAIAHTLFAQEKLRELEVKVDDPLLSRLSPFITAEDCPFLKLNASIMNEYNEALFLNFYQVLKASQIQDPTALNLWIRANSPTATTPMDIYSKSLSREVLASLVERGGNVLKALHL